MKNITLKLLFLSANLMVALLAKAQTSPSFIRDMNALPDTAFLFPVKVVNDANNNVFVLSTYQKTLSPTLTLNKIYLNKYDQFGNLQWTLVYDNNGTGQPRGFDMAVDNSGNCYIAGGLMETQSFKPLLLKIDTSGAVTWQRDSTIAFNFSNYDQIILKNYKLHVKATYGIATFDLNGTELWSNNMAIERMAVDNKGQIIFSAYLGNPTSIFRFDSTGTLNFSDSAIVAKRIAVDADNSFYLLTDMMQYQLVKYDSSGNLLWSKNDFPVAPPFGDIGFDVLIDNNNDVIVIGLSDTMYKLSSSGNVIWQKPMNSLDSYLIVSKIIYSNIIAIAGSIPDSTGYGMKVAFYDLNGNQNWWGYYNSNPVAQEFTVDLAIDNSGVYAIENNDNNTTLVKFDVFTASAIDYSLICVDSVWYDPFNPNYINVNLFNGNVSHLNYPSVQIVSPVGDTISNPNNDVTFFAHIGNSYLIYYDTITSAGITDFSNYTFLVSEGFGDTTVAVTRCTTTDMNEVSDENSISIYPNPASDFLIIEDNFHSNESLIQLYNCVGLKVYDQISVPGKNRIDLSSFSKGMYFVRITNGEKVKCIRFIKG